MVWIRNIEIRPKFKIQSSQLSFMAEGIDIDMEGQTNFIKIKKKVLNK